jgi:hypothetical protein
MVHKKYMKFVWVTKHFKLKRVKSDTFLQESILLSLNELILNSIPENPQYRHSRYPKTAMDLIQSVVSGAAFGAALTASGVWNPVIIVDQMRLHDFHMVKVFLTASSVSA